MVKFKLNPTWGCHLHVMRLFKIFVIFFIDVCGPILLWRKHLPHIYRWLWVLLHSESFECIFCGWIQGGQRRNSVPYLKARVLMLKVRLRSQCQMNRGYMVPTSAHWRRFILQVPSFCERAEPLGRPPHCKMGRKMPASKGCMVCPCTLGTGASFLDTFCKWWY